MNKGDRYEDAFREMIQQFRRELDLVDVVPDKREYEGRSTSWEIDVSAYRGDDRRLVTFECRNRGRNVEKGHMGAFAYVVEDLGSEGIVVSPKELSSGAKEIADFTKIGFMRFTWDEQTDTRILHWLGQVYVALYEEVPPPEESLSLKIEHIGAKSRSAQLEIGSDLTGMSTLTLDSKAADELTEILTAKGIQFGLMVSGGRSTIMISDPSKLNAALAAVDEWNST